MGLPFPYLPTKLRRTRGQPSLLEVLQEGRSVDVCPSYVSFDPLPFMEDNRKPHLPEVLLGGSECWYDIPESFVPASILPPVRKPKMTTILKLTKEEFVIVRLAVARMITLSDEELVELVDVDALKSLIVKFTEELKKSRDAHTIKGN